MHPYHMDMSEEVARHFIALQAHATCTYQRPVDENCITLWALTYEPWFCIYEVHLVGALRFGNMQLAAK